MSDCDTEDDCASVSDCSSVSDYSSVTEYDHVSVSDCDYVSDCDDKFECSVPNLKHATYLANVFDTDCCNNILNFLRISTIKTLRKVSKKFKNIIYNLPYSCDLEYYQKDWDEYHVLQKRNIKFNLKNLQVIPDFRWLINFMPNTVCASMNYREYSEHDIPRKYYGNNPSHFLPYSDIFKLQNLKTLKVYGFIDISCIENLTKLEKLCLTDCYHAVTDHMIRNLVNLQYLKFYIEGRNEITDVSIGQLVNLRHLDIFMCRSITDASIEILTNLEYLNIGYCTNITDKSVEKLKNLKYLDVSHCKNITDASISKLTKLETLIMSVCNEHLISDEILKTLQHLSNLQRDECCHDENLQFDFEQEHFLNFV